MTYHVFNGDALKEQLAGEFDKVIVARECLVDGPVAATNLEMLWGERAAFLTKNYGGEINSYFDKVVSEFDQLMNLPADTKLYLWFEDDLFCQVNFWFVCHLLVSKTNCREVYYVRPDKDHRYGFGWMSKDALMTSFSNAEIINDLDFFADLWLAYQSNDLEYLSAKAKSIKPAFQFVAEAISAHLDRIPKEDNPGKPQQAIIEIMQEFPEAEFGKVFQEFCKRLPHYGFGDVMVKRMWERLRA